MKEIEVKVIEINKESIIKKLDQLGAKKLGEYDIKTLYFDYSNKSLLKNNSILRLRKKGKNYLTFKKDEESTFAKKSEEIEIEVSDFDKIKLILENLGLFSEEFEGKHRITYKLNNALIEIEEIKGIPPFLEIEAESEDKIKEIINIFGFKDDKIKPWNGFELLSYYKKNI